MLLYHVADVHLGKVFHRLGNDGRILRERHWEAFEEIIERGKEEGARGLLLSGDLYEREFFTVSDYKRLIQLLESAAPMEVFLIGGNHDFLTPDSYLLQEELPSHVHIFHGKPSFYDWDEEEIRIHGVSWDTGVKEEPFYWEGLSLHPRYRNILLFHGTLNGTLGGYPLSSKELEPFDYVALGHIHKGEVFQNGCYAGCLLPGRYQDPGRGSFGKVEISPCGLNFQLIPLTHPRYLKYSVTLKGEGFLEIRKKLLNRFSDPRDLHKIIFKGESPKEYHSEELRESLALHAFHVEMVDETKEIYSYEEAVEIYGKEFWDGFLKTLEESGEPKEVQDLALSLALEELGGVPWL